MIFTCQIDAQKLPCLWDHCFHHQVLQGSWRQNEDCNRGVWNQDQDRPLDQVNICIYIYISKCRICKWFDQLKAERPLLRYSKYIRQGAQKRQLRKWKPGAALPQHPSRSKQTCFFWQPCWSYPLGFKDRFVRQHRPWVVPNTIWFGRLYQAQLFWQEPEAILRENQEGRAVQAQGEKGKGHRGFQA